MALTKNYKDHQDILSSHRKIKHMHKMKQNNIKVFKFNVHVLATCMTWTYCLHSFAILQVHNILVIFFMSSIYSLTWVIRPHHNLAWQASYAPPVADLCEGATGTPPPPPKKKKKKKKKTQMLIAFLYQNALK